MVTAKWFVLEQYCLVVTPLTVARLARWQHLVQYHVYR